MREAAWLSETDAARAISSATAEGASFEVKRRRINSAREAMAKMIPEMKNAAGTTSRRLMPELPMSIADVVAIRKNCVMASASANREAIRRRWVCASGRTCDGRAAKSRKKTPPKLSASSAKESARSTSESRSKSRTNQIKLLLTYAERNFAARNVAVGGEGLPPQRVAARRQRSMGIEVRFAAFLSMIRVWVWPSAITG